MPPTLPVARRSPLSWSRPATTGRVALLRDVQLLEAALAAARDAICVHAADGTPLVANAAALELLGAFAGGLDQLVLPQLEQVRRAARDGRGRRDVKLRHRRSPEAAPVSLTAQLQPLVVGGSVVVICRLAEAPIEAELRRVASRLRLQVESLREGVVLLDVELAVRSMNGAARRLLGEDGDALWDVVVGQGDEAGAAFAALVRSVLRERAPRCDVAAQLGTGPETRRLSLDVTPVDGHAVVALRDITREHHREAELLQAAYRDQLTGLGNRRLFDETLERALRRARRYERPLAVCLLDVDGLKEVNDRHGHAAGDRVLRRVGEALRAQLRDSDLSARGSSSILPTRYGGDEFLVLFDDVGDDPRAGAQAAVRRVLDALESEPWPVPLPVSVSAGVAAFPADGEDAEALVAAADARMYEHKRR